MPDLKIDENLVEWDELASQDWKSLLVGNGFSINIWEKFGYGTLYELAKSDDVDTPLSKKEVALFDHLGSSNFEDVLRILYHAKIVDEQLGSPQEEEINRLYVNTKNALASAVNYAHIPPNSINALEINNQLRPYKNVFSTNYDLIPYWSIMESDTWRFKDFFWGEESCFDISDTDVNADRTKIHYLHGAIHLVELTNGKTKKLTANGLDRLSDLFDLSHPEQFPLFISEGSSDWKLSRIKRNDYLRFCYEKLGKIKGGLVVLGHSLHKDYDQHIIDTINDSDASRIAIGVWPHQGKEDIVSFKARLTQDLGSKELYFFDSETHPLGATGLNVPVV
ncbi:DUF4917 family protein [Neptuniibacter sp. 1_MG-2023]|uniref:DUF4917 family protein n=1 Tax=Neptuniibacter sp. 1_MG-2023 TaxID=3062662 RepID=UPI0026E15D43|nr:DUF4917 family protein [Neptuniibacter sp. 1_MG-2023]MDO6593874.1 DUF4917 family protein [Neptuniibacter sp. 1_MG-2023]